MDLRLFTNSINKKISLSYYSTSDIKIKSDNYSVLGFKDNLPVISLESNMSTNEDMPPKKPDDKQPVNKFEMDETGEKYINLNGQKLKVVPQGQIPEEVRKRTMILKHQMINIGSLKKPLKVRVISSATQVNNTEKLQLPKTDTKDNVPVNVVDKQPCQFLMNKKIKLITVKGVIKSAQNAAATHNETSTDTVTAVNPKTTQAKPADTVLKSEPITVNLPTIHQSYKLLTTQNLKVFNKVKMQALNLSKKKPVKNSVSHIGVQTDDIKCENKVLTSRLVQTDEQYSQDIFEGVDLAWLESMDSPIINNVSFGVGPHIGKVLDSYNSASVEVKNVGQTFSGKRMIVNEERMKKQLSFFRDLRECLTPNTSGNLLLHDGVINNDLGLVKRMCTAMKARRIGVNQENLNGCTPLQLSVINDTHPDIVDTLLNYGADALDADGEGNTILHLGAKYERHDVLQVILYHPAIRQNPDMINSFNFEGLTPLMICCISNWISGAVLFIDHGANVNLKDLTSGRTALFHAAEAHNIEIVRLLLDNKADPKIKNFFGTSPHDAMYELEEMPEAIKNLIFGKTKKRTIEAEMNPIRTAKAAKSLKTFSRLKKIEPKDGLMMSVPGPPLRISEVK